MSISIVIPVFNQSHHTERCLRSLLDHSSLIQEIFVIDNHSTDNTAAILESFKKEFHARGWHYEIIHNLENRGFGRACNQGIAKAKSKYTLILNNDTWQMPSWDHVLTQEIERLKMDMVGPYILEDEFQETELREKISKFIQKNKNKWSRDFIPMALFFRTEVIQKLGGFDERFFVTSEDDDLRERMDRAGYRYAQVANCVFWHHSRGTRAEAALPKDYEIEGLRLFKEKWGFDHRDRNHALPRRLRRSFQKIKRNHGYF